MIITRLSGGMGNQMFQYAVARALSIKNETKLCLDVHDLLDRTSRERGFTFRNYDLDLFTIHACVASNKQIPWLYRAYGKGSMALYIRKFQRKCIPNKTKEKSFSYDENILNIGPVAYLDGYWQSYKYFISIENIIRTDFTFNNTFPDHVERMRLEIIARTSVCIHVRRGDYVGNAFHEIVTKEYYSRALQKLEENIDIQHLYVFSDDIAWCRENLFFNYETTFAGEEYAGDRASGHFLLMRSCSHFIIPNSSFAWWAAWLAPYVDKIVIAPKKWFADDTIDTTDLIPPEWIRI